MLCDEVGVREPGARLALKRESAADRVFQVHGNGRGNASVAADVVRDFPCGWKEHAALA